MPVDSLAVFQGAIDAVPSFRHNEIGRARVAQRQRFLPVLANVFLRQPLGGRFGGANGNSSRQQTTGRRTAVPVMMRQQHAVDLFHANRFQPLGVLGRVNEQGLVAIDQGVSGGKAGSATNAFRDFHPSLGGFLVAGDQSADPRRGRKDCQTYGDGERAAEHEKTSLLGLRAVKVPRRTENARASASAFLAVLYFVVHDFLEAVRADAVAETGRRV